MTIKAVRLSLLVATALFLGAACGGGGTPRSGETPTAGFTPAGTFVPLAEGLVPVESGFADANGVHLYYEIYGEGEPLLLIPGTSQNHLRWTRQVPVYAREFKVIVFDPRGTGQSSFKQGVRVTAGLMADDAASLLGALGVESAHVYGISLGGMVAQEVALRHPEMVRSLILGAADPGGSHRIPAEGWVTAATIAVLTQGAAASQESAQDFLEAMFSPHYLAEHETDEIAGFFLFPNYPATSAEAAIAHAGAVASHDTYDRLPIIRAPTLVIDGADDPQIPAENSRILAERIPGAELVLLEGGRHLYLIEKQAEADAAVLDFLRAHSR